MITAEEFNKFKLSHNILPLLKEWRNFIDGSIWKWTQLDNGSLEYSAARHLNGHHSYNAIRTRMQLCHSAKMPFEWWLIVLND